MLFINTIGINASNFSTTIWASLESIGIILTPFIWLINRDIKTQKKLDRIEYAIFNDGKTGLKNKVDEISEDLPAIKTDIAIIKFSLGIEE